MSPVTATSGSVDVLMPSTSSLNATLVIVIFQRGVAAGSITTVITLWAPVVVAITTEIGPSGTSVVSAMTVVWVSVWVVARPSPDGTKPVNDGNFSIAPS